MFEQLRDSLNDLRTRLRLILTRGRLTVVYVPATNKGQKLQARGLQNEVSDGVDHAEDYGLAFHPVPGAELMLGAIMGQRAQLVALKVNDPRGRPTDLKPGEVCFWSSHGQRIHLRENGGISVFAPGGDITVNAPAANITIEGNVSMSVGGDVDLDVAGTARLDAAEILLGDGDHQPLARIGDLVKVQGGSSAGFHPIVSGSAKVKAG